MQPLGALLAQLLLLLLGCGVCPVAAPTAAPADQLCGVRTGQLRQFQAPAAAAGLLHLGAGLDTCRRADGGGALVATHFQVAPGAGLLAELHEQLPPVNDPAGALGGVGACAALVLAHGCAAAAAAQGDEAAAATLPADLLGRLRGVTLAQLCPASCPGPAAGPAAAKASAAELLRSPLLQPAAGCGRSADSCPRAVLLSLPTGGVVRSYTLRVYAAPAGFARDSLPLAAELSVVVAPVPWRDAAAAAAVPCRLPERSALFPTPFSAFTPSNAVLITPLRRHLALGARYNFEVAVADAEAVALVPAQSAQGAQARRPWVHLAPAEGVAPKDGVVRWRGSAEIKASGELMLMAKFSEGATYDALVNYEATADPALADQSCSGVSVEEAWQTPVHIMPSAMSSLDLRPVSHPYGEIFLDDPHLTLTLTTRSGARLRVKTSSDGESVDGSVDSDPEICVEAGSSDSKLPWEQPRIYVTHNCAGTEHTVFVHWNHPDLKSGRLLKVYVADLAMANGPAGTGWPQVLEYSVWVAPPEVRTAGQLLGGIASSLGGWLAGAGLGGASFVPLRRERAGSVLAVEEHVNSLPHEAAATASSLAEGLCVWDDPAWNYRAIFGWVSTKISYDKPLLAVLEGDPGARKRIRPMAPQDVLDTRSTVCSGYADLTAALCLLCVTGHAKSNARIGTPSAQRLGHAWVAVHVDGRWQLSDPTWASSDVDDAASAQHERHGSDDLAVITATELTAAAVDDYYYLPSAAELLPTHLPEDPLWQLLDRSQEPIIRENWDHLPKVKPSLWKAGLTPVAIPRGDGGGDQEAAVAMERAESAWELCEASAGGRDGWRSLLNLGQWVPWSGSSDVHCASLHRAGRREYPVVASAFSGTSGEWEVARFGLRAGAPTAVDLLPKVWAVDMAHASDRNEAEDQQRDSGWHSLASVRRENDEFSVHVVLPTQGVYVLRVYVALPEEQSVEVAVAAGSVEPARSFVHAVDFLLDASGPNVHWVDCVGCMYPRMFGAAGALTLHAPRQRRLQTGHDYNLVLELPSSAREQTMVVRDAGTGRDIQLHRTTIGALLGVPKLVRAAYAGSFRCAKAGLVTVFTRWRGEKRMRAMMEFECHDDGHAPVEGTGGVIPPSNVAAGATSTRCERLACLPVLPNTAFIQDEGITLGLALVSHTAAAWSVAAASTATVVVSTVASTTISAQLKEVGIPGPAQHDGIWTFVSSSEGGLRHEIEIRCRRPWRYELLLFAAPRANDPIDAAVHMRSLPMVVQYTVDATPAEVDPETGARRLPEQFPRVSEFSDCFCELLQPRVRHLLVAQPVNFSLVLGGSCSNATGVAVIQDGDAPWVHLQSHVGDGVEASDVAHEPPASVVWSGLAGKLTAGAVRIAMQLPSDEKQYHHLVEFEAQ